MIDTNIKDGLGTSNKAEVTSVNALHVATEEYYSYSSTTGFFSNPTYGIDMNENFSSATGELVNDGGDTTAWLGVQTVGTSFDFQDTNNPSTGSNNISVTNSSDGDLAFFYRGSNLTITNQIALQGDVYITSIADNKSEIKIQAWDTLLDVSVGGEVKVYDYINKSILGSYQTFNIPLVDMSLAGQTFDALRFKLDKNGQYLDFDQIEFTIAGGAGLGTEVFNIAPTKGTQLVIDGFIITMADAYSGTVANGTMPGIPYQGFLGIPSLDNGLLFRVINLNTNITFVANITDLIEFFQFADTKFSAQGSDGTNTWFSLKIDLPAPIILNSNQKDRVELVLSDNLSGLLWFRWSIDARERDI